MIYTCTLNPCIDYVVEVDNFELGKLNRVNNNFKTAGGKGIIVSRVLKRLNVDNVALGFIGGFSGEFIKNHLENEGLTLDFVQIDEASRININLKSGVETNINAQGPKITKDNLKKLYNKINQLTDNDTLILAGSVPPSLPSNLYETIIEKYHKQGIKFVVDASGELLLKVINNNPFLVKPNHHELGGLFNVKINSIEAAKLYGQKLVEMGAENVIVSMGRKGAVFLNKDISCYAKAPDGEVKNTVGAGDSMVAGFVSSYNTNQNVKLAFKTSIASGTATAFSMGLCTQKKVNELMPQIEIKKL